MPLFPEMSSKLHPYLNYELRQGQSCATQHSIHRVVVQLQKSDRKSDMSRLLASASLQANSDNQDKLNWLRSRLRNFSGKNLSNQTVVVWLINLESKPMVFPHLDGRSPGREGARVSLDNLAGFARDPMTDWEDTTGWGRGGGTLREEYSCQICWPEKLLLAKKDIYKFLHHSPPSTQIIHSKSVEYDQNL